MKRAPLRLSSDLVLPLRQEVGVGELTWPEVLPAIRTLLEGAGYDLVTVTEPEEAGAGRSHPLPLEVVAEREPVGAPMSHAGKVSVYTLLGAGIGLGIFDALAVGAPFVAIPWGLGAVAIAVLFWYRYGRGFESDVVVVVLRADGRLIWFGGRVRSEVRAGDRTGFFAVALPRLGREMGAMTRGVTARLADSPA